MTEARRATGYLLVVTGVWGAAFPAMKVVLQSFTGAQALTLRFSLAALCLLPWAWSQLRHPQAFRLGVSVGGIMWAIYSLLAVGLRHMSAARCAFLMGTTVVFVQLWQVVRSRRVVPVEALGAVGSVVGLFLLTGWGHEAPSRFDLLVLAAACLSAMGLIFVHHITRDGDLPGGALTFWQLCALAAGAGLVMVLRDGRPSHVSLASWVALLFCALLASALGQAWQMRYQHQVSRSAAAMIFALKPLFAALCNTLIFDEAMRSRSLWGGAVMLTSALLPPAWSRWREASRA